MEVTVAVMQHFSDSGVEEGQLLCCGCCGVLQVCGVGRAAAVLDVFSRGICEGEKLSCLWGY